jgi:hypothetical protein
VLVADVRDWESTRARYADAGTRERSVRSDGRELQYATDTTLDRTRRLMLVRERYRGRDEGVDVDQRYEFVMRCWTDRELRACARAAGFTEVDVRRGAGAGIAPDRLLAVARLG